MLWLSTLVKYGDSPSALNRYRHERIYSWQGEEPRHWWEGLADVADTLTSFDQIISVSPSFTQRKIYWVLNPERHDDMEG